MLIIMLTVSRGGSDITEARSCSHCCSARAISITYYEGVFVALGTQHASACAMCVMCGLSGSKIFFPHYVKKGTIFEKESY